MRNRAASLGAVGGRRSRLDPAVLKTARSTIAGHNKFPLGRENATAAKSETIGDCSQRDQRLLTSSSPQAEAKAEFGLSAPSGVAQPDFSTIERRP